MSGVALSRAAGEKRQQAQVQLDELKAAIAAQASGETDAESRLTADEITQRKDAIASLLAEAKALEGVDSLDGIMSRPADELSDEAKRIMHEQEAGGRPERKAPFEGIGDFMRTVRTATGKYDTPVDLTAEKRQALAFLYKQATRLEQGERLEVKELGDLDLKTLVGDDTSSTGRGDYLVPTEHMTQLLRTMGESQQFASRARRVPMSRRTADFPRLAQTDATDTRPFFSFAAITKIAEGAQKPEREPVFEQLTLTAIKYAAYVEAADELLSDDITGSLAPVLVELLTGAIAYEYDRDTIRGSGNAEPQGFIGSNAEYAVNRASSGAISTTDVFNMESRFFGDEGGIYMFHPSVIPQLYALAASNVIAWQRDISSAAPGVLLGRPLIRTHKLPTLNAKGDLCLVDPSFYLVGDLQRVTVMNSIHYAFRNDVTAWRATFRAAGTPWPAGTFSHEASGGSKTWEVSPFVSLDIVAS